MNTSTSNSAVGNVAMIWGIAGFLLLLVYAIVRLTPIAWEALQHSLTWMQWLLLIGNTLFMAYSEGYRGFQVGYSPRVVSRAMYLRRNATAFNTIFAPLFCMSYFSAPRRRVITSWVLTVAIIILIILFHKLSQPWRGILDAGVVVGLSWGTVSTVLIGYQYFSGAADPVDPEIV
ncbi:MAG: hypothetical protein AAF402_09655 [Pseudomonadota bacterium]